MKIFNIAFFSAALLIMTGAASCTQEYTCQCTIAYTGTPGLPDSTINEYPVRDTKKKAKEVCEAKSATYQNGSVTTRETCKLY